MGPTTVYDRLNIVIDWSSLEKVFDDDQLKHELVIDLPPYEENEDFWLSSTGQQFRGTVKNRPKDSYRHGLQVGNMGSGDTFSIVPMTGRKPPTRK